MRLSTLHNNNIETCFLQNCDCNLLYFCHNMMIHWSEAAKDVARRPVDTCTPHSSPISCRSLWCNTMACLCCLKQGICRKSYHSLYDQVCNNKPKRIWNQIIIIQLVAFCSEGCEVPWGAKKRNSKLTYTEWRSFAPRQTARQVLQVYCTGNYRLNKGASCPGKKPRLRRAIYIVLQKKTGTGIFAIKSELLEQYH